MLSHHPDCKKVGEVEEELPAIATKTETTAMGWEKKGYTTPAVSSTTAVYDCVDDCPAKLINDQSGTVKGGKSAPNRKQGFKKSYVGDSIESCKTTTSTSYDDTGGAARFFENHDWDCHEDCAVKILDDQSGITKSSKGSFKATDYEEKETATPFTRGDFVGKGDEGGASRFFYCPKVSKKERNFGCEHLEDKELCQSGNRSTKAGDIGLNKVKIRKNNHPTVKPIALMRYLIRLITPPGEICMDPFLGSGSTGMAAVLEGRDFIGIEMSEDYLEIARARIEWAKKEASNG
jgi:hypothetical protein